MIDRQSGAERLYRKITEKKRVCIMVLTLSLALVFLINIAIGPAWLSIPEVMSTILCPAKGDRTSYFIVWTLRLPIALTAIAIGAALATAGAEMQTILSNPLASPYTLGIASAAGFGAALAMIGGIDLPIIQNILVPLSSFIFALIACIVLYTISKMRGNHPEILVLAGIAIMFMFSSLLALLQFLATEDELQAIVFWLFGSLYKTSWSKLGIISAVLLVAIPLLARDAWKLTAMRMGNEKAMSLGVKTGKLRMRVFLIVSVITGIAVCFAGTIGFIGLVGPHIARILVGEDQRFFLPTSAIGGAVLLSAASIGSKLVMPGAVFPIGIVTSLIGVPFFVSLILSKKRRNW